MNPRDPGAEDPILDAALSQLPRTMTPSEGYADRVLGELRERRPVGSAPPRSRRMLIAAAWFVAGVGTGAAALSMLRREPEPVQMVAISRPNGTSMPAEPVEWY